jgi:hypothetical protein
MKTVQIMSLVGLLSFVLSCAGTGKVDLSSSCQQKCRQVNIQFYDFKDCLDRCEGR